MTTRSGSDLQDLVDLWVAGFGVSRGVPVRRLGPVTEVEVGSPKRRLELVLVEPDAALARDTLARLVGTTDTWSTVITSAPTRQDLPTGVRVELADEALMTVELESREPTPPAVGRVDLEVDGERAFVRVRDGEVDAAFGQVAVVGPVAVFDRVGTAQDYRRRGLGTVVMHALEAWAVTQGATTGILAASVDGQHLYAGLGWRRAAAMVTLSGAE